MKMLACAIACLAFVTPVLADDLSDQVLEVHNRERAEVGAPPLTWSDDLAASSAEWALHLASLGELQHSGGRAYGENLWMGSTGYYSYSAMAQSWADEKRLFVYGTFPKVSSDGNWANVGHYTQVIWKNTTQVGCAVATGGSWDILVCRYGPPGNWIGEKPY